MYVFSQVSVKMDESEFETNLIAFVEARPFLYDKKDKNYKSKQLKDTAFQEFALIFGRDGILKQ